jgi:hypothetical protein
MSKRMLFVLVILLMGLPMMTQAQQLQVVSQPDSIYVFQNDVAYVRDTLSLPAGAEVNLVLPPTTMIDTLILRENGARVMDYRVRRDSQIVIAWRSEAGDDLLEISAEYLLQGMSWQPKYDMMLNDETASASFDFFAEIQNNALTLQDVEMFLVAGRVGTSQILADDTLRTANQLYAASELADTGTSSASIDSVTIQHIYELGTTSVSANETLYTHIVSGDLPARRVLLWNAPSDQQVTVIYKVKNETTQPFSPGIVRSYRDGLILGSDAIERTPIGSEGSITVGTLPDVRVSRGQTSQQENTTDYFDTRQTVTLEITNFGEDTVEIEVVEFARENAIDFRFDREPTFETNNVLRWVFVLEPGQTIETTYDFLTP